MTRLHRLRDTASDIAILRVLPDPFREARAPAEVSGGHERERVWDMWATADWADALALSDKAIGTLEQAYEHGDPLAHSMSFADSRAG